MRDSSEGKGGVQGAVSWQIELQLCVIIVITFYNWYSGFCIASCWSIQSSIPHGILVNSKPCHGTGRKQLSVLEISH